MKKMTKTLLALSVVGAFSGMAQASSTEEMTVTAKVVGDCTVAVTDIDFGDIFIAAGSAPDLTASGSVVATCPSGADFFFEVVSPNKVGGSPSQSTMVNTNDPSKKLVYDLWADQAGTIGAFGGHDEFNTDPADFSTISRTYNIYAVLAPTMTAQSNNQTTGQGESIVDGTYVDTLTLNINYAD